MITVYYKKNLQQDRDFHVLWEQVIDQLKLHTDEIQVVESGTANIESFGTMEIFDCELLLNYNGKFKGISLSDYHSDISNFFAVGTRDLVGEVRTEDDTLLIAQGSSPYQIWSEENTKNFVKCKVLGGIYTPQAPHINFEQFRIPRDSKEIIDKFVFKGNVTGLPRKVVPYLENCQYYSGTDTYNMMEYLEVVSRYKVGLCIPGAGEICHRDIEYMAMGVPMLKFEYMANLSPKLIPNVHYISIPRIDTHPFEGERSGGQKYADLYIQRFLEVKDDKEFLQFISKNAMEYYDTYLRPENRVRHIFKLWELPFYE